MMFLLAGARPGLNRPATPGAADQVVKGDPKFTPTRLMLAQLLIREGKVEEAAPHIDELERLLPDSPIVTRLKMLL